MKLFEPKRHKVDLGITTSTDKNASWQAKSHPLALSNLTFIEPEISMPRDVRPRIKIYSRDAYVSR
jgi:hypothetical protein